MNGGKKSTSSFPSTFSLQKLPVNSFVFFFLASKSKKFPLLFSSACPAQVNGQILQQESSAWVVSAHIQGADE